MLSDIVMFANIWITFDVSNMNLHSKVIITVIQHVSPIHVPGTDKGGHICYSK